MSLLWQLMAAGSRPGRPRGLLAVLPYWERTSIWFRKREKIPGNHLGLLEYRLRRFRGPAMQFPDGSTVVPGDVIGAIHCNNAVIAALTREGVNFYAEARLELSLLAEWLNLSDPDGVIRALRGWSLISPAAARLGCYVRDGRRGIKARLDQWFMMGLLLLYTPGGMNRLKRGASLRQVPRELWLTRRQLTRRYGRGLDAAEPAAQIKRSADPESINLS